MAIWWFRATTIFHRIAKGCEATNLISTYRPSIDKISPPKNIQPKSLDELGETRSRVPPSQIFVSRFIARSLLVTSLRRKKHLHRGEPTDHVSHRLILSRFELILFRPKTAVRFTRASKSPPMTHAPMTRTTRWTISKFGQSPANVSTWKKYIYA